MTVTPGNYGPGAPTPAPIPDKAEIDAGHVLDALVAEKVMGYAVEPRWFDAHGHPLPNPNDPSIEPHRYYILPPRQGERYSTRRVPPYSTDIAAGWDVVGKLQKTGENVTIWWNNGLLSAYGEAGWECEVAYPGHLATALSGLCDTAPLAICRTALKVATPKELPPTSPNPPKPA